MLSDSEIEGCFGSQDYLFALHPSDADRAFELLTQLRYDQALWSDVRGAFEAVLVRKGCGPGHVQEQIAAVEEHFAPWLYGDTDA